MRSGFRTRTGLHAAREGSPIDNRLPSVHRVGRAGFEPATSRSRTERPSRLGHLPMDHVRADGRIRTGTTSVAHWDATVEHHACRGERTTGFEPVRSAWKADMLPLNITPAEHPLPRGVDGEPGDRTRRAWCGPHWLPTNLRALQLALHPCSGGSGNRTLRALRPSLASNQVAPLAAHPPGSGVDGNRTRLTWSTARQPHQLLSTPCVRRRRGG